MTVTMQMKISGERLNGLSTEIGYVFFVRLWGGLLGFVIFHVSKHFIL